MLSTYRPSGVSLTALVLLRFPGLVPGIPKMLLHRSLRGEASVYRPIGNNTSPSPGRSASLAGLCGMRPHFTATSSDRCRTAPMFRTYLGAKPLRSFSV